MFDFDDDVFRRMVLEPEDGRSWNPNAMLAQRTRELLSVVPAACCRLRQATPSPIHSRQIPSSTSSSIVHLRIALADAKTDVVQLLRAALIRSSRRTALAVQQEVLVQDEE